MQYFAFTDVLHRNHDVKTLLYEKTLFFFFKYIYRPKYVLFILSTGRVEPELLHTYSKVPGAGVIFVIVRLAVLMAVTLTVPIVIFPVSTVIFCVNKINFDGHFKYNIFKLAKNLNLYLHLSLTIGSILLKSILDFVRDSESPIKNKAQMKKLTANVYLHFAEHSY